MTQSLGFIANHGLWTDEQRRQAEDIKRRIETDNLHLVRLAWADPHGASRAKAVTAPGFAAALTSGHNINVATSTLDSANARIFDSFTRGGGMGLEEMTGSPNLTIVPDPATFRVLPWAPGVGWVLCDEYFNNGVPFHFSPRQLLRKQLKRLAEQGIGVYEVRPGVIRTDMTSGVTAKYDQLIADGLIPQNRWGLPEDVGRTVAAGGPTAGPRHHPPRTVATDPGSTTSTPSSTTTAASPTPRSTTTSAPTPAPRSSPVPSSSSPKTSGSISVY